MYMILYTILVVLTLLVRCCVLFNCDTFIHVDIVSFFALQLSLFFRVHFLNIYDTLFEQCFVGLTLSLP